MVWESTCVDKRQQEKEWLGRGRAKYDRRMTRIIILINNPNQNETNDTESEEKKSRNKTMYHQLSWDDVT